MPRRGREVARSPEGPTGHQGVLQCRPALQGNRPKVCWGACGESFPCHSFSSDTVTLLLILV